MMCMLLTTRLYYISILFEVHSDSTNTGTPFLGQPDLAVPGPEGGRFEKKNGKYENVVVTDVS